MVLDNLVNKFWKATKGAVCGLMIGYMGFASTATGTLVTKERIHIVDQQTTVDFYYPKYPKFDTHNEVLLGIETKQKGIKVNQIDNAWMVICVGEEGQIGEPQFALETRDGQKLYYSASERKRKLQWEQKFGGALLNATYKILPNYISYPLELMIKAQDQQLAERDAQIDSDMKDFIRGRPSKSFYLPKGQICGVTSGYEEIFVRIPIKGTIKIDWWLKIETSSGTINLTKEYRSGPCSYLD